MHTRNLPTRIGALIGAILLSSSVFPVQSEAQDRIGEIVQPSTGADRAVYVPMDQAVILPRFLGKWATSSGKCRSRDSADRMELQQRLAVLGSSRLPVRAALVEVDPQGADDDSQPPRAQDYANAEDILVRFGRPGSGPRHIHFRFVKGGPRLIVEEVGKPRRAYIRCS